MTICSAIFRGLSWKKVPQYIFGQVLGAFLGSLFVYSNYFHAIDLFEGGKGVRTVPGTASLFATYSVSSTPEETITRFLMKRSFVPFRRHTCPLRTAFLMRCGPHRGPLYCPGAHMSCILSVVPRHVPPFDRCLGGHRPTQRPPSLRVGPTRHFLPHLGNWCRFRNADRSIEVSVDHVVGMRFSNFGS